MLSTLLFLRHTDNRKRNKIENKTDQDLVDLNDYNLALESLRDKKIQGMIIRSRIQWIQDGEKPSKYFCNLENRNFVSKQMSYLQKDDGDYIFDNEIDLDP